MGCRHHVVADRLEDLVDEGGSRSSWRAHEHENFQLVSLLKVAILIFWSRCPSRWTLRANQLVLCAQRVSPFYHDWIWVWLGWLRNFCLSSNFSFWSLSNFWTQLFHPVMLQGDLWRRTRWRKNFFENDVSNFHPNNSRDTTSWECFVKNDLVRSCLIELQSFPLSKFDVDPIHRVLMFLPCLMHVLAQDGYTIVPEESAQDWHLFLCALPLFVRPMMTKNKMILKIIFYPPEFNRYIFVSR